MRAALPWWERSGRLILALWFILPGLVSIIVIPLRYFSGEFMQVLSPMSTAGVSLLYVLIGGLAASGKPLLAAIFLSIDLAVSMATLGGLLSASASEMGGESRILVSMIFSAAGAVWALGRRYGGDHRTQKTLAIALVIAFALNVPGLASRFGRSVGDILAPAPLSRFAEPGNRLPDLRLTDLSGDIVRLDEPGRLYVLNFWATWCGPCRVELPQLLDMFEAYPEGSPVQLLAVNTEGLGREDIEVFLEEEGLTGLDVFTDPSGSTELLDTGTIPLTVLIRDRTLLTRHVGYSADTIKRLREEIVSYLEDGGLEEPAVPPS